MNNAVKMRGVHSNGPVSGNPWGLSAAELMTLREVRKLGTTKAAAMSFGVGVETLRTHEAAARRKMAARNKIDALCLLAVHDDRRERTDQPQP
jgi:DNA-binding CsgD family transcriptional regulator